MRIDQWVPALHRGDAIGDSARLMRDAFRSWGYQADVWALEVDEDLVGDGRHFSEWPGGKPSDAVLLHFALPSPLSRALAEHPGPRVLLHHNITPPEFFVGYDPEMVRICTLGRRELQGLAGHVDLALADSEFNRRELEEAGFPKTGVLPIYLDFGRYAEPPNPVRLRELRDGRTNVLFVGRVSPNKKHEDLLRVAAYWKRFLGPDLRLLLVGKLPKRTAYFDSLQSLSYELGFTPAEVVFTSHVDHPDLLACYRSAHLFLSMSEHEGFGVPLVESMLMGVPVLARAGTAVSFTMGGAGVVLENPSIPEVAEAGFRLVRDLEWRAAVLRGQENRLEAFRPAAVEAQLRGYFSSL